MPGPYIHMSAMRAVADALSRAPFVPSASDRINPKWTGMDTVHLGQLMKDHPNFASLGAIGPDLFFFLPDFRDQGHIEVSSILVVILRFLEGLYATLDPFISKYEKYLGPVGEDTGEEISRLTGGLSETVGKIAGELSSILITALEDFVTKQGDIFAFFSLGHNKGLDEQAFLWSDMLHYRKTGQFGRSLWTRANAIKDPVAADQTRAYVLGYLTHLATDVTGHALVNSIAGGPFRLHWQRHHLVENHMDAFWYLADPAKPGAGNQYPQFTESALYYDISFNESGNPVPRPPYPTGDTLRENYTRRRLLDADSAIPSGHPLPGLLIDAMTEIFYADGKHPKILRDNDGKPSEELIKQTYDLLFRFLKFTTVDGFGHEPPDLPKVWPNLDFPVFSDPHEDAPGGPGGGGGGSSGNWWDDFLDFVLSVIKVILYVLEVALWLATLPWALLTDLVTYPLRLGLYYALELPLFHMLKSFRLVMVMTGYFAPMEDEIAFGLVHVGLPDPVTFDGVLHAIDNVFPNLGPAPQLDDDPFRDKNGYPRQHPDDEYRHPWDYPADSIPVEKSTTTAGPYPRGASPTILFANLATDAAIRERLEAAKTPTEVDTVDLDLKAHTHLGDPVSFSQYLIWLESRANPQARGVKVPLVDWNLDADRGYGYHDWDWNRHGLPDRRDPEGYGYQAPCTWPSQSDDQAQNFNADVELQIHFTEVADPGCGSAIDSLLVSDAIGISPPLGGTGPNVFNFGPSATIVGGSDWKGRITLSGPVADSPLTVTLKSGNPALLTTPATKIFAVGDRVLEIRGSSVATLTNTDVTITASAGGGSKSAVLHVVRPPEPPR